MYDIIISNKRRINIIKIVILVILVILLVGVCTILGMEQASKEKQAVYLNELKAIEESKIAEAEHLKKEEEEKEEKKLQEKLNFVNSPINEKQKDNVLNIYNKDDGVKRAYLTFDDGPTKAVTPLILDKLKEYDIKATFFVLGQNVKYNPNLVQREYNEGHYIANHGYTHTYSKVYSSIYATLEEYNFTENAIRDALGNPSYNSKVFRFPGGSTGGRYHSIKQECKAYLLENGIVHLDWNALNEDAAGKYTKEQLLDNVKSSMGTKKNVVILMHDSADKILTYEMLPELIDYLKENEYEFCTLYDILSCEY